MGHIFSELKRVFKHGLVTQAVLRRLDLLGIGIHPYYWIQEGIAEPDPALRDPEGDDLTYEFLSANELAPFSELPDRKWCTPEMNIKRLERGKKCFGVKRGSEVLAFNWFDFEECTYEGHKKLLKKHEAYLFDMYTPARNRGMNLAPRLRIHSYQVLRKMGYSDFFSISYAFNKPAVRFKLKLNSKILQLCLLLELFGKFRWQTVLRQYD